MMLDFNDLYTIQIGDIVHICRIIYYDKINDTYTISVRGNGILSGIKEDQLEDISKHPLLPPEYQQIEWLKNSGDAYINTLFKPNQDTSTEVKFQCHEKQGSGSGVFGTRYDYRTNAYTFILGSNGYYAFSFGSDGDSGSSENGKWDNDVHIILREKNIVKIDDVIKHTNKMNDFTTSYNALLFTYNNQGSHSPAKNYTVWYCKIWEDTVLVRDMYPCYRKSDNALGMYDIVNNMFHQKQGSGTFIAGPDVEV